MNSLDELTLDHLTCLYGGNRYEAMFRLADGIMQGNVKNVPLPAVDGFSPTQIANHYAMNYLTKIHFDVAIFRRQTGIIK